MNLCRQFEKNEAYCVFKNETKQVDKFYSNIPDSENVLSRHISKKILLNNLSSESDKYNKLVTVSRRIVGKLVEEAF